MRNYLIRTVLPRLPFGGGFVLVSLASDLVSQVPLGSVVDVLDVHTRERYRDDFVLYIRQVALPDVPEAILQTYGFTSYADMQRTIGDRMYNQIPSELPVTLVIVGNPDAEFPVLMDALDPIDSVPTPSDVRTEDASVLIAIGATDFAFSETDVD